MTHTRLHFVVLAVSLAGCAAYHERDGSVPSPLDAGPVDAGPVSRDGGPLPIDAGTPDAAGECLPSGSYAVQSSFSGETPPGCLGGTMPSTFMIHVPPVRSDFSGMCSEGAVDITPIPGDACAWAITTSCAIPDASSRVTGTLSAHTSGVAGSFSAQLDSITGPCAVTLTLSPAR